MGDIIDPITNLPYHLSPRNILKAQIERLREIGIYILIKAIRLKLLLSLNTLLIQRNIMKIITVA
jgi:biotin operon repressor